MSMKRTDRKPPLARSPMRLRPRRVLHSTATSLQTPPGSLTKTQKPTSGWETEESKLRPEYLTISSELRALANMVHNEFGSADLGNVGFTSNKFGEISSPLFERGRFYEEYSARRNERLKRKKGGDEKRNVYDLGVKVESAKRRESKKLEGMRKSVPITPMTDRRENSRYLLRSSTRDGIKKPPLAVNFEKSVACSDRKVASLRVRKI